MIFASENEYRESAVPRTYLSEVHYDHRCNHKRIFDDANQRLTPSGRSWYRT